MNEAKKKIDQRDFAAVWNWNLNHLFFAFQGRECFLTWKSIRFINSDSSSSEQQQQQQLVSSSFRYSGGTPADLFLNGWCAVRWWPKAGWGRNEKKEMGGTYQLKFSSSPKRWVDGGTHLRASGSHQTLGVRSWVLNHCWQIQFSSSCTILHIEKRIIRKEVCLVYSECILSHMLWSVHSRHQRTEASARRK